MNKQKYVVGLMFSLNKQTVLLIRKNKPLWQLGLLNGVGGKVEEGETPAQCMVREFKEEVGLNTEEEQWTYFAKLCGTNSEIYFYKTYTDSLVNAVQLESEIPMLIYIEDLSFIEHVPNLKFLIEMALLETKEFFKIDCYENIS